MALYENSRDPMKRVPLARFGGGYLWLLLAALMGIVVVMSMTPVTPVPSGDATNAGQTATQPTPSP